MNLNIVYCRNRISELVNVNKENIIFTSRCNVALDIAFDMLKARKMLIQEEGGWIHYLKYAKKHDLNLVKLKVNDGKIILDELKNHKNSFLVVHSTPGYGYEEDMKELYLECKKNNILLINDCCGSIGTDTAKYGDITVCSFGKWKPLSCGGGGFIATNEEFKKNIDNKYSVNLNCIGGAENKINFDKLLISLASLNKKLKYWKKIADKIKKELPQNVMNKSNKSGINVFLKYDKKTNEKEKLIKYCQENSLEYVVCPKYIRTMHDAISIEIKRLESLEE